MYNHYTGSNVSTVKFWRCWDGFYMMVLTWALTSHLQTLNADRFEMGNIHIPEFELSIKSWLS
jgi:hypothetical protein